MGDRRHQEEPRTWRAGERRPRGRARDPRRPGDSGPGPRRPARAAETRGRDRGGDGRAGGRVRERQGHDVTGLEAQNRVGGRIFTCRDFAPGLHAELGAIRILRSHDLTLRYCDLFGLEPRPFVMGNPKGLVHVGGSGWTMEDARREPHRLPFDLADARAGTDRGRAVGGGHPRRLRPPRPGGRGGVGGPSWPSTISTRWTSPPGPGILRRGHRVRRGDELRRGRHEQRRRGDPPGGPRRRVRRHAGGRRRHGPLAERVLPRAGAGDPVRPRGPRHRADRDSVAVHVKTEAGPWRLDADHAICAVPFPVLRTIEVIPPLDREKQRAIRQLNYHASTKVLLQVRRRSWEEEDGIFAGPPSPICRSAASTTRRRTRPPPAACSWPRTRGARTPSRGGPWTRRPGWRRPSTTWPRSSRQSGRRSRSARSHAWYSDRGLGGRSPCSPPEQQTELQEDIVRPEAGSLSPGGTARCITPGSRGPWSRGSGPPPRSIRRRFGPR
jgi:monoamine oxidase